MEQALQHQKFTIREVASEAFLNQYLPVNKWQVEIGGHATTVAVDGLSAELVHWNKAIRTLAWNSLSADFTGVASGVLYFDREFAGCHGNFTLGSGQVFLVESNSGGELPAEDTLADADLHSTLAELFGSEEPLPAYDAREASTVDSLKKKDSTSTAFNEASEAVAAPKATHLDGAFPTTKPHVVARRVDPKPAGTAAKDTINLLDWNTKRRKKDANPNDPWLDFQNFGIGTDQEGTNHDYIRFGTYDISQSCDRSSDGRTYTKVGASAADPCPWAFKLTFSDAIIPSERTFTGELTLADGAKDPDDDPSKVFDWQGFYYAESKVVAVPNTQHVTKGSDGLLLNTLLFQQSGVDPNGRDLAQAEADRILNRLCYASIDEEVSKMLFPQPIVLSAQEERIQKIGPDYLKYSGIHNVMRLLAGSSSVKPEIQKKINVTKCEAFGAMCAAIVVPPNTVDDAVPRYGLDRVKDKDLIQKLQDQGQLVSRECFVYGYTSAVQSLQPFLKNAGEWYNLLEAYLTSSIASTEWLKKAREGQAFGKALYDLRAKLDVFWHTANQDNTMKAQLKTKVQDPTQIMGHLVGTTMVGALDTTQWTDESRQKFIEFFENLDAAKDESSKTLADELRRQLIADGSEAGSLKNAATSTLALMEELRNNRTWSVKEVEAQLALLEAKQAKEAALLTGQPAPPVDKKQIKAGFFAYARAIVTLVGFGSLLGLMSSGKVQMDWADAVATAGQLVQAFSSLKKQLADFAKSVAEGARTLLGRPAQLLQRYFLAPLGAVCSAIGGWLWKNLPKIGKELIQGITKLADTIKSAIATGLEKVSTSISKMGTWLKKFPINWGGLFNAFVKTISFGLSALCFYLGVRDCMKAYADGRLVDKIMTTILAAIAGFEVLILVIQGISYVANATRVVAFCSAAGPILAVVGVVFAVVYIIVAFTTHEDPLMKLVEKYGGIYGLLK